MRASNCSAIKTKEGFSSRAWTSPARCSELAGDGSCEGQDGDVSGVRFFGVGFEGFGDGRQGVALAVGVPGGLADRADQLRQLFHSPGGTAAAFDVARAARSEQAAMATSCRQHAESIATDHAATFVGDGVGRRA